MLHLYRMYGLHPVTHGTAHFSLAFLLYYVLKSGSASLRPPDANPTKETKGRKSTKRARAKAEKLLNEQAAGNENGQETDMSVLGARSPRKRRRTTKPTIPVDTSDSEEGGWDSSQSFDE